jgi:chemotaxis protein CheD
MSPAQNLAQSQAQAAGHASDRGEIRIHVGQGEHHVTADPAVMLTTVLGSCVAACLTDPLAGVGGMNHFLLPDGGDGSGRYGSYAMELLINELLKQGATRAGLEAKVFGGGQVISGMNTLNIGERNARFVLDYLKAERIPLVVSDVLGAHPRKVCFLPASGKAMVKRLAAARPDELVAQERLAAETATAEAAGCGSIDLF